MAKRLSKLLRTSLVTVLVLANLIGSNGVLLAEEFGGDDNAPETAAVTETQVEDSVASEPSGAGGAENAEPSDEAVAVAPEVPENPEITEGSEGAVPDAAEPDAVPEAAEAQTYEEIIRQTVLDHSGRSYTVTVSYGPETGLPEDAELVVREITAGNTYTDLYDKTLEVLDSASIENVRFFDISIVKDNVELEPAPGTSVNVKIQLDDRIDEDITVVHLPDNADGEIVESDSVAGSAGTEITFEADGFSAYAIVPGPDSVDVTLHTVSSVQDLIDLAGTGTGIYIGNPKGYYFMGEEYTRIGNGNRTGIKKTLPKSSVPGDDAEVYYFVYDSNTGKFTVHCGKDDNVKYIRQSGNSLYLTTNASQATPFTITENGTNIFLVTGDGEYYWNMQNGETQNASQRRGFAFATWNENVETDANAQIRFWYRDEVGEDPFDLNGKTLGLMYYNGGTAGKGLVPTEGSDAAGAQSMSVLAKKTDFNDKIFVSSDCDITMWDVHWDEEDKYIFSTVIDGSTKYLHIDQTGVTFSDTPQSIQVIPGAGGNAGKISLKYGNNTLSYSGDVKSGFIVNGNPDYDWLNIIDLSDFSQDYFLTYSANKVGVNDKERVYDNGENKRSRVIIYTRFWNKDKKKYEFYAVDYDGSLVPVYEDGDTIEWVDNGINTLLWDFIEYKNGQNPNGYYDLFNEYSEMYIAPQFTDNQIMSSNKIGINLPGRYPDYSGYYTPFLAWDNPHYSYAGLKVEQDSSGNHRLVVCSSDETADFYFAILQDVFLDEQLHKVPTVDNNTYGITMRMKDFTDRSEMSNFLGNNEGGAVTTLVQGLLSTNLGDDGYPTVTRNNNKSLKELYYNNDTEPTTVNHLFIESIYRGSGYFEYDSTQNFATLKADSEGKTFTVYQELGSYDSGGNKNTLKHGQFLPYDDIEAGHYGSTNGYNLYDATGTALKRDNPRYRERLHLIDEVDLQFGMELETSFVQTPSGRDAWGHDIIYEFTGDDDFWLYVDGELVIDLGGIHSAVPGSINYCTGEVNVNGERTTLKKLFESNYKKRGMSDDEIAAKIAEIFEEDEDTGNWTFKDYTFHTMKIFYMERGGGASNLHMRFNQSSVKPGTVVLSKDLGMQDGSNARDLLAARFPFQIYYFLPTGDPEHPYDPDSPIPLDDETYDVFYQGTTLDVDYKDSITINGYEYRGVYFIKPGEVIEIHLPDNVMYYQIKECGVNNLIYNEVYVNGDRVDSTQTHGTDNKTSDYMIDIMKIEDRTTVKYVNKVDPGAIRSLTFKKVLYDEKGEQEIHYDEDPTLFNFRLYIGSESDTTLKECNMYLYYVLNEDMEYCRWDVDSQSFVSIGKTQYDYDNNNISEAELKQIRFTTSMYGAISKIPSFYTVEVKGLLVGNKYKIEERLEEIPDGYALHNYEKYPDVNDGSSHTDTFTPAEGSLEAGKTPHVNVVNYKGYGLRVNKIWTDDDFMDSRGDTYFAVFKGDDEDNLTLVTSIAGTPVNTVRRLASGNNSLYWYFEHLDEGKDLSYYWIREVKISNNNPTVDDDGVVTNYGTVTPIDDGGDIELYGRLKGETDADFFKYTVNYERGSWTTNQSTRIDTATNDRPGVIINKNDWSWTALPGAGFTIQTGSGMIIGNYTSDDVSGFVSKVFPSPNVVYYVRETSVPKGYQGLTAPIVLSFDSLGGLVIGGADQSYYRYDSVTQVLDIRNKNMEFSVLKTDAFDTSLPNAHFSLHKKVSVGGFNEFDPVPVPGFADVVSGADGILPGINNQLAPGEYKLKETAAPAGFVGLPNGVTFNVSKTGVITLTGNTSEDYELTSTDIDGTVSYTLQIKNQANSNSLKITKTVLGNFGSRTKEFSVDVLLKDSSGNPYVGELTKTVGTTIVTITPNSSGIVHLTIADGGEILLDRIPSGTRFTVTEDNESYTAKCYLDGTEQVTSNSASGVLRGDMVVHFENTLNGVIPTGVGMSFGLLLIVMAAMAAGFVVNKCFVLKRRREEC
ncbi:fibro-slime domain-containing protein [Ruminococcaceae bacterium YRB3002]|nr:fibro-slime domain-containing protein [Ruminococcaceae bacterium YRB3002]